MQIAPLQKITENTQIELVRLLQFTECAKRLICIWNDENDMISLDRIAIEKIIGRYRPAMRDYLYRCIFVG